MGYEALARGPGDTPMRNPEILFAYATRKQCLLETDLMCISAAMRHAPRLGSPKLFLNMHPRSLTSPDSADRVTDVVARAGIDPKQAVIELTEHHAIVNPEAFRESLERLRARGFGVALDDFGVGYANVRLLSEIQPEFIKLSGYFAMNVDRSPVRQKLVAAMADMAQRLGTPVIAEGIETETDLAAVRELGVPYGQGYLFARPASADDLIKRFEPDGGERLDA
jgi:EAL domain-containing protein (putative c-di-GMP-specific phosphodiesterase class I)